MQRMLFTLTAGLGLLAAGRAAAQADPHAELAVTPAAGPWMICVASYTGPKAHGLAHELAQEVRQKYRLPAYVFNRGDDERRKQKEEVERIRRLCGDAKPRIRIVRIEEQCAVLVGGYRDMDAARRALDEVKKLKPPAENLMDRVCTQVPDPTGKGKAKLQYGYINPFARSFVVRNPTAPPEPKPDPTNDPILKKLNAGEPYSLLECRKPYTMAVAVFNGAAILEQQDSGGSGGFLDRLIGRNAGQKLQASALNAHNLAEALRKLEFEAYVLHTRNNSVVAVGGFDRADDPTMRTLEHALRRNQFSGGGAVQLMARFLPMEVPRP